MAMHIWTFLDFGYWLTRLSDLPSVADVSRGGRLFGARPDRLVGGLAPNLPANSDRSSPDLDVVPTLDAVHSNQTADPVRGADRQGSVEDRPRES
jgi:hypothetical protein